ncbi:phospholipase A1 EG1, chloroplastic/mitochondrial-like [Lolium rigidum]|uniref:phospholipase A1 EG1, chloroplastic/mitochondrial-like n=1 Tax=Lolium rigidum TaxID=89674 RepID=UPI001F5C31F8|nr:phospholipase A1 EG1, chloroplastic/mitochondrial-like [Lolium rigidum]
MAAAKLAVAPSSPTKRLRACMPPVAATSTTHVTLRLSSNLQHKPAATTVAVPTAALAPVDGRSDVHAAACSWQEVHGADDWRGLVEPLHPLLRAELVRYGELVAACYRAFDLDPRSKRYLNCKHGKKQILRAVGMADAGYEVTRYIYAAPDVTLPMGISRPCSKSRWIGYVAVASDKEARRLGRRDILVSFRGTVTCSEWLANFMSALAPARFDPADPRPNVRVESGFLSLYTSDNDAGKFTSGSCRNQLLSEISRLIADHKHEDISITLAGHSMGSSLALLLGYDLAELGMNRGGHGGAIIPITVFSFGGPRVGNLEFKHRCDELGVKVLRVANANDPVTKMPGILFNEAARVLGGRYEMPWSKACYAHVGVEVALDFFKAGDVACVHDLEVYINQLLNFPKDAAVATASPAKRGEDEMMSGMLESVFESWRWKIAVIRTGEWLRMLGI